MDRQQRPLTLSVPNLPLRSTTADRAEFRQPGTRGGVELYRARIVRHAFEPHTHAAFGIGVIEQGAERFRYRGSEHFAGSGCIVLMNPDVMHTGRAASAGGWAYRMAYIDEEVLAAVGGEPQWWFPHVVTDGDRVRAERLSGILRAMWEAGEPLAFDSLLALLVDELRPHARVVPTRRDRARPRFDRVVDYMRTHLAESVRLEDLASVAGLSPFHFLRTFRDLHHSTPQQMLMALRLHAAKEQLARGRPPAAVAADTGLSDQAHLTRAFARRYGTTPARYQRQIRR